MKIKVIFFSYMGGSSTAPLPSISDTGKSFLILHGKKLKLITVQMKKGNTNIKRHNNERSS